MNCQKKISCLISGFDLMKWMMVFLLFYYSKFFFYSDEEQETVVDVLLEIPLCHMNRKVEY